MAGGWGCEVVRWRDGDLHGLGYHVSNSLSRGMFTTRVFECVRGDTLAGDSVFGRERLAVITERKLAGRMCTKVTLNPHP
jgi:hypothetical protein